MRIVLFLVLCLPNFCIGQNWVGLDQGLECFFATNVNYFVPTEDKLYTMGSFQQDGNCIPMRGVAVWNGTQWDSLMYVNSLPAGDGILFKDTLYLAVHSDTLPINQTNVLGKWTGDTFDTLPKSKSGIGADFTTMNNELYFCGAWRYYNNHPDSSIFVGKYDGAECKPITNFYTNSSGSPITIEAYQGQIYVGGQVSVEKNGLQLSDLMRVNQDTFELFHPMFQGPGALSMVRDLEVFQGNLYIGGSFLETDGFGGNNIMYWDGTEFHACGAGTNNRVRSMKVYNDELYCAGWFTEAGGQEAKYLAKWDGSNWFPLNIDELDVPIIEDLAIWRDELYICGNFTEIGGESLLHVAKLNHPLRKGALVKEVLELNIFPNPAETSVQIDYYQLSTDPVEIMVTNTIGQLLYQKSFEHNRTGVSSLTLDVTGYAPGAYIVRLSNSNYTAHSKFIRVKS